MSAPWYSHHLSLPCWAVVDGRRCQRPASVLILAEDDTEPSLPVCWQHARDAGLAPYYAFEVRG